MPSEHTSKITASLASYKLLYGESRQVQLHTCRSDRRHLDPRLRPAATAQQY